MSKRRGRLLDPEDILAGRARASASELFDLIHRVNPTGQGLGARDAEQRYRLKSRLQSLLVRRFPEHVEVIAEPGNDGVVSLRRPGGGDACHAVVDALDDDARAWVTLQIDLGPPSSVPAPAAPSPRERADSEAPDDLLALAREAEAAYDYERARELLEQALAESDGAPTPAAALLALLADTLGDDGSALAIQPRLSREALANPAVRAPLAAAAARAAMARGDLDGAADELAALRRADPAHPAIAELERTLGGARAAERAPLEAGLAALVEAGRDDEAAPLADEILGRWPESEAARRAQRTLDERRRQRDVQRLTAEGEEALAGGDVATACAHLGAALAAARGAERPPIEQRLRDAEAQGRDLRAGAAAREVERRLAGGPVRDALAAYLDLDDAARARIDAGPHADLLRRMDRITRGSPRARIDAALALTDALGRAAADPDGALALLDKHPALEGSPEAAALRRQAESALAERRAARAVERAEAEAREAEEDRRRRLDRATSDVARLRAQARFLEARDILDDLLAGAEGEAQARWEADRAAVQAEIQRQFRVWADDTEVPAHEGGLPVATAPAANTPRWLADEGRTLVLADAHERWVRIRLLDVAGPRVRATVLLRTPEPLDKPWMEVQGDRIWLIGSQGALLVVTADDWTIERYQPRSPGFSGRVAAAAVVEDDAGQPFVWLCNGERAWVIDVHHRRTAREIPSMLGVQPVTSYPWVLGHRDIDRSTSFEPNGARSPSVRDDESCLSIAAHPDGSRVVTLVRVPAQGHIGLAWLAEREYGVAGEPQTIPGADGLATVSLAGARDPGLVVVVFWTVNRTREVLTLGRAEPGEAESLRPLYRRRLPPQIRLVQDAAARTVATLNYLPGGLDVRLLGPDPDPDPPADSPPAEGDQTAATALLAAVQAADACLRRGDHEGALAALDQPVVWDSGAEQALARAAEAAAATTPASRRDRFRRILALARFVDRHGAPPSDAAPELRIPGAQWRRGRLDDLAARARRVLDDEIP